MGYEKENVGPRMAVTVDGDVLFFDEKGAEIKNPAKMNQGQFIEFLNSNELIKVDTISVFSFGPSSACKIIFVLPDGTIICFLVDCQTGRYIGPC